MNKESYFWLEERDIPSGNGFTLWGNAHKVAIIVIVLIIVASIIMFERARRYREMMLRSIAVLLPILEILKISVLTVHERMDLGHLPIHLCSIAIYIYPLIVFTGSEKVRQIFSEISVITLLPAAVCAIAFPDWTMYPIINFYSLHSFIWHMLQIIFPILCLKIGWCKPSIKNIWKNLVFLIICAGMVLIFDHICNCNYWFLMRPVSGTPLQNIYDIFGKRLYLPALALIVITVNVLMYGAVMFFKPKAGREEGE